MWYKPENESTIATPSLLLFPDRIEENIRRMIALAGSAERLRPHVKSHKIPEIIQLQRQQGITRFKCATLSEVTMVAEAGGEDILLAYPLLGPSVDLWFELVEQYTKSRLSVTVDSETALILLESQACQREKQLDIFVDIDNGMHRTGIHPEEAPSLIYAIENSKNLIFKGLHIYDGHIHESGPAERKAHCDHDFEAVHRLQKQLSEEDIEIGELACGGTPTFPIHASHPSRTLCPGTTLLWDAGYGSSFPDLDFLPAAVIAGRVISKPNQGLCLDLGHKSIASEMAHPRLHFLELEAEEVIHHSEEHLALSTSKAGQLSVGDLVYALPVHICPTTALHEQVYVVRNQQVTETWRVVARKRDYPYKDH
ncbi:MAG: D-TA family PLP-dependent enzyme [Bacteroidales bacterium]|nr:D-TA family PLP-dependent enzyme [Bacteroidales bacterium]